MKALLRRCGLVLLLAWPLLAGAQGFELGAYRGKVVYLDFWASWCPPCLQSFPWMKAMQAKYGPDGLVIVAVNVDRQREAADAFLAKTAPNFTITYDPDNKLFEAYQLIGMPTALLFDRQGVLRTRHVGWRADQRDAYEGEISALLREKSPKATPAARP